MPVDVFELMNFFKSRGAKNKCPICGFDGEWLPAEGDDDVVMAGSSGRTVPAAVLICDNCGFIRLHSTQLIRNRVTRDHVRPSGDPRS
jgi:predicted RNA-binding Zn-ribbon protein involved in translation (DUF1610 family)